MESIELFDYYTNKLFNSDSLSHSSQWVDENGNNTPAYNHKYWVENADEIMARRRLLQAGADPDSGKYSESSLKEYTEDLTKSVDDYIERNKGRLSEEDISLLKKELADEIEKANKGYKLKDDEEKKEETKKEEKKTDSTKASSTSNTSTEKDKKTEDKDKKTEDKDKEKSSSSKSSSSSSGSSRKKSSSSSSKSKSKGSSGRRSSGGSKSNEKKLKAPKSSKSKESSKEKSSSDSKDSTTQLTDKKALSKISNSGYESGQEPLNNFANFMKELGTIENYSAPDFDAALDLWKQYRKSKGMDTADSLIEDARNKRSSLQHSVEVFDDAVLQHFGILGMRWGKRNGPPYPLNRSQMSSAEKKAAQSQPAPERQYTHEEIVNSGDLNLVKKYADRLSTNEINSALNRADALSRLDQKIAERSKQQQAAQITYEKSAKELKKEKKAKKKLNLQDVKNGLNTYNEAAKLFNLFSPVSLPVFDKSAVAKIKERKEKEKKKQQKQWAINGDLQTMIDHPERFTTETLKERKEREKHLKELKSTLREMKKEEEKQKKIQKEKEKAAAKEAKAEADAEKEARREEKRAKKEERRARKEEEERQRAEEFTRRQRFSDKLESIADDMGKSSDWEKDQAHQELSNSFTNLYRDDLDQPVSSYSSWHDGYDIYDESDDDYWWL